jgi:uncharacterized protein (TIRG00374 family)
MPGVRIPKPIKRLGLLLAFFLVIEYAVLPQVGGVWHSVHLLGTVSIAYAAAAVVAEGLALFAYAKLTEAVLPAEDRPHIGTLLRIDLSTLAASHIVPGGTAAGAGLGYRLLADAGVGASDVGFALGTQGLGSALVLNVLLWVGLVVSIPLRGFDPLYATAALVGVVLFALFAAAVIALTRGRRRSLDIVRAIAQHVPLLEPDKAVGFVEQLGARLGELGRDRGLLRRAVLWATANWVLDAACLWIFILAFGHQMSIDGLLVSYGLANVLAAIPITPGGLGVVEAVLIPTLVGFGAPHETAIAAVIAYRLLNFWLPIPIGGIAYLSLRVESGAPREARWLELVDSVNRAIGDAMRDLRAHAGRYGAKALRGWEKLLSR